MAKTDPQEAVPITVELFVPDVEASVRFYTEKLGFAVQRMDRESLHGQERVSFAVIAMGRAVLLVAHERLYGEALTAQRGAGIDVRIMVDDVDAMFRRSTDNDVTIVHDIGDRPYGLRDFIICDPDGFRLRFATRLS
ncbi:MAG: VOC family protein [Chloroflexi bacterium]|nr:VOC family protein [Chloroflexota bacterium]